MARLDTTAHVRAGSWSKTERGVCVGLAAVGVAGVYAPILRHMISTWWEQPDYSHGFFIVPVALAIFWRLRPEEGSEVEPSRWGWVLLAGVLAARTLCHELGELFAERSTLVLAAAATVVAYGGFALIRSTWPAVAYLSFMLTVPASLETRLALPLQRLAAEASGEVLRILGFWVVNEGHVLVLGAERLEVATACNGLAMSMSLSATVVAMILLIAMPRWKRIALLIGLLPIALSCNVSRIVATAWCYNHLQSEHAREVAHDAAGWLMMPMALVLVGLELRWLSWLRPEPAAEATTPEPRRERRGRKPALSTQTVEPFGTGPPPR